jgi:hypothetical protein
MAEQNKRNTRKGCFKFVFVLIAFYTFLVVAKWVDPTLWQFAPPVVLAAFLFVSIGKSRQAGRIARNGSAREFLYDAEKERLLQLRQESGQFFLYFFLLLTVYVLSLVSSIG